MYHGVSQRAIDRFAKTGTGSPRVARAYAEQQAEIRRAQKEFRRLKRQRQKMLRENRENLPKFGAPDRSDLPPWRGR